MIFFTFTLGTSGRPIPHPPRPPPLLCRLNTFCGMRLFSPFAPQLETPRWQTALTVIGCLIVAAGLPRAHASPSPSGPRSRVSHPKSLTGGQNHWRPVWRMRTGDNQHLLTKDFTIKGDKWRFTLAKIFTLRAVIIENESFMQKKNTKNPLISSTFFPPFSFTFTFFNNLLNFEH